MAALSLACPRQSRSYARVSAQMDSKKLYLYVRIRHYKHISDEWPRSLSGRSSSLALIELLKAIQAQKANFRKVSLATLCSVYEHWASLGIFRQDLRREGLLAENVSRECCGSTRVCDVLNFIVSILVVNLPN
jgi:hypothetical protein